MNNVSAVFHLRSWHGDHVGKTYNLKVLGGSGLCKYVYNQKTAFNIHILMGVTVAEMEGDTYHLGLFCADFWGAWKGAHLPGTSKDG